MNSEITKRYFPLLAVLILLSLLRWQFRFELAFFVVGMVSGYFLLYLDQIIYCYLLSPHEFNSQRFRRFLELRKYQEGINLLVETQVDRKKLVFHSIIFQLALLVFALFILTSSSSLLGEGLVLGMFLHTLVDQIKTFLATGNIDSWFWQFKGAPPEKTQTIYLVLMTVIFFIFSLL